MRPRLLALLLAAALLVAGACGGSQRSSDAGSGRYGSSESDTGTSTEDGRPNDDGTSDESPTSTVDPSSPPGTQAGGRPAAGSGGASRPSGGAPGTTVAGGGSSQAVRVGPYGSLARSVLGRNGAANVVVEVIQQAAPRPGTVDYVTSVLREVAPKNIERPAPVSLGSDDTVWTADEIRSAADRFGRAQQSQSTAVLRLLFLRGRFDDGGGDEGVVLGVAVRGDVAAMFVDEIARAARPLLDPAVVEQAVTTHELGHLLGLVDVVLKTGRVDPEHREHSRNPQSVMYWAVESDLISQVFTGEPPRRFDREDLADLAAIRDSS
jgi:hypothetical protein